MLTLSSAKITHLIDKLLFLNQIITETRRLKHSRRKAWRRSTCLYSLLSLVGSVVYTLTAVFWRSNAVAESHSPRDLWRSIHSLTGLSLRPHTASDFHRHFEEKCATPQLPLVPWSHHRCCHFCDLGGRTSFQIGRLPAILFPPTFWKLHRHPSTVHHTSLQRVPFIFPQPGSGLISPICLFPLNFLKDKDKYFVFWVIGQKTVLKFWNS